MIKGFWWKGLVIIFTFILIGNSSISLGQIENKSTTLKPLSNGKFLYVNTAWLEMLGYQHDSQLLAKNMDQ